MSLDPSFFCILAVVRLTECTKFQTLCHPLASSLISISSWNSDLWQI